MEAIKHNGFSVDPATNLITFDDDAMLITGSLVDGDTMYLQQGRICLDAMLCFFDTDDSAKEEHCMWQIEVFEHVSQNGYGPDFCNYSHCANVPHPSELKKIDTVCIYAKDGDEEFKQCFQAYTEQMHKLIKKYSTLTGI